VQAQRLVFSLLLAALSFTAEAREINFSAIVTDQDGAPILDCVGAGCTGPPLTLGSAAMRALVATFEDDKNLPGEEKFKRGELALRVYKGGTVDLSAEDVALIKKQMAKGYGPIVVLRTWKLIDPESKDQPAQQRMIRRTPAQ